MAQRQERREKPNEQSMLDTYQRMAIENKTDMLVITEQNRLYLIERDGTTRPVLNEEKSSRLMELLFGPARITPRRTDESV